MAKALGRKFADPPPCSVAVAGLVGTPPAVSVTRGGKWTPDAEKEEAGGRRM